METNFFTRLLRRYRASKYGVPYEKRVWYNYAAMIPKNKWEDHDVILIFDKDKCYIPCPGIGGLVTYSVGGVEYIYEIVGFKNESRYSDWLYDSDYIHPIIRFVKKK